MSRGEKSECSGSWGFQGCDGGELQPPRRTATRSGLLWRRKELLNNINLDIIKSKLREHPGKTSAARDLSPSSLRHVNFTIVGLVYILPLSLILHETTCSCRTISFKKLADRVRICHT